MKYRSENLVLIRAFFVRAVETLGFDDNFHLSLRRLVV